MLTQMYPCEPYIMDNVLLDLTTIFKIMWKDIYDQLHDYLFKTRVEV